MNVKGSDEKVDCLMYFWRDCLRIFFDTLSCHHLRTRALYTVAGAYCLLSIGKFCRWKPYGFNVWYHDSCLNHLHKSAVIAINIKTSFVTFPNVGYRRTCTLHLNKGKHWRLGITVSTSFSNLFVFLVSRSFAKLRISRKRYTTMNEIQFLVVFLGVGVGVRRGVLYSHDWQIMRFLRFHGSAL